MPEELRNRRHLKHGYCAHLAQADRSSWTNPGTELLLSPRVGGSAIREVRGLVEETHKSTYITGSNDFACVRGQEIYVSKPSRSMSLSERY
jgi:hypothetical protein